MKFELLLCIKNFCRLIVITIQSKTVPVLLRQFTVLQFSLSRVAECLSCWQIVYLISHTDWQMKVSWFDPQISSPSKPERNQKSSELGWECPSSLCQRQQEPTCINSGCILWIVPTFSEKCCSCKIPETNTFFFFFFPLNVRFQ